MPCSLPCQIYALKSFQDDWSQVNNRQTFTDKHLLIPINSEGLYIQGWFDHRSDVLYQNPLMRIYKQIRKLHLKLYLKEITSKIYAKS